MTFEALNLDPPLLKAVAQAGYQTPSPIQQKAIPPVLAGRDLLGCAQTGTGKTAAFALPILQLLSHQPPPAGRRPIRSLILTPTRELALQIQESFETYGKHLPLRSTVIFGGVGQGPQVQALQRGVDVLVATPGRLNDLIGQGHIKLDKLQIFVLDEADRMLDMGFVNDVKKVIRHLPAERQNLFFSATMPPEIVKLAGSILHNPAKVFVTPPATTVEKIDQHLYKVDKTNKRHLLAKLLRDGNVHSALVFTRTKHGADRVVRELKREGLNAVAIHGNKSQNARVKALSDFKAGKVQALVATDIAARGLDISELSHVFNYDLPNIPETYVHRIGRTGRAGHGGTAISFCCVEELPYLADIQKLTGLTIPEEKNHPWPMMVMEPAEPVKESKPARKKDEQKKNIFAQNTPKQKQNKAVPAENQKTTEPQKPAQKPPRADKKQPRQGRRNPPPDPYEQLTGGRAIIYKKPVWATAPAGAAAPGPDATQQGDDSMSRNNNRRRRGKSRGGQGQQGEAAAPQQAAGQPQQGPKGDRGQKPAHQQDNRGDRNQKPNRQQGGRGNQREEAKARIPKNENGIFDFSEEELAEDTSLRLIGPNAASGETKYASFEDYLKDH